MICWIIFMCFNPLTDWQKMKNMANAIRVLTMDAIENAASGHPGMPMGMADVAAVLFSYFLKHDPKHPHWPDRDRFILSAGHGSMLLYSLLYLMEYPDITLDDLKNFRSLGSVTPGHPELLCYTAVPISDEARGGAGEL